MQLNVAEGDLADIKLGTRATVTFRSYRSEPVEGVVAFIYPDVRTETRTVRVRIEVPYPDGRLKTDMYADVVFHVNSGLLPAGHGQATQAQERGHPGDGLSSFDRCC